eukprot:gene22794-27532_t
MERLDAALHEILVADNAVRDAAEAWIDSISGDMSFVPELLKRLQPTVDDVTRQITAVVLSGKIGRLWSVIPEEQRVLLKSCSLEALATATTPSVQKAFADLVNVIAQITVPSTGWSELLPALEAGSQSVQPVHRETSAILLAQLADSLRERLAPVLSALRKMIILGARDSVLSVRLASLKGLCTLAECADSDSARAELVDVIPPLLQLASELITSGATPTCPETLEQ